MSRISARVKGSAIPSAPAAIIYDTRFGTATDANGWFTFGLRAGSRRVWCDANRADDTGDGLSAATAKKTLMAAWAVFINAGFLQGDQLMLAGTGGRTYTDDGTSSGWFNQYGLSVTYPLAVLCFDPSFPADATKYGRLLGQQRPRYYFPATGMSILSNATEGGGVTSGLHGNFAAQGLIIDAQNLDGVAIGATGGRHPGIVWQNCQFKQLEKADDNATSVNGQNFQANVSKCSLYGMWRALNGNTSGLFHGGVDGLWVQDCVFAHCGWKIGSSRDDLTANGGNSIFGHSNYFTADGINGRFDRNVYVDSASDGWGIRGTAVATQLISIDEPIAGAAGGFSTDYRDNQLLGLVKVDDFTVFGGNDAWTSAAAASKGSGVRGQGIGGKNTRSGSYVRNGVLFDNPFGNGANGYCFSMTNTDINQLGQSLAFDRIKVHNYSTTAQNLYWQTGAANLVAITYSNCLFDGLASFGTAGVTAISGPNVRTWVAQDYPNPYTKNTLITAMGFASKAAMVNAMIEYPHLAWAQAILGLVFAGYGSTPQFATAAVPDISSLPAPTSVYAISLVALTISKLTFTRATPSTALISGLSANPVLTCANLPAGFTLVGRLISYDGSGAGAAAPTINVLETNGDGLGTNSTAFTLSIS